MRTPAILLCMAMVACTDPEVERQKRIMDDRMCKLEQMAEINKSDDTTIRLAKQKGKIKEYQAAFKAFTTDSISCATAQKIWLNFEAELVDIKIP